MPPDTTYPGVYVEELPNGPRSIAPVATSITAFVGAATSGPVNEPALIHGFGEFERIFGGLSRASPMSYAVKQFFLNGGRDALIVRVQEASGSSVKDADVVGARSAKTGIYALENVGLFNLLCIPPLDFATDPDPSTLASALEYCEERRAMLIVDPPLAWRTKDDVEENLGTFIPRRRNAAVYFPRLRAPDPLQDNQPEVFAPCGAVAGVMARIDAEQGVWNAAAGLRATVAGVRELACELSATDLSDLNSLAVNCLRTVPVGGAVIFGARTMEGSPGMNSEWKYVPVRRLSLFLEESIRFGIAWAAYEANDESLWLQLRACIGAFMHGLYLRGAFQGARPDDAYLLKCDSTTTTQADVDSGIVNIHVGFAPLKPAEFVILRFAQKTVAG